MEPWILWRLLKLAATIAFAGGLAAGTLASAPRDRQVAVYKVATTGFLLSWLAGYAMVQQQQLSLGAPWISASLLSSLLAMGLGAWAVEAPQRRGLALTALVQAPVLLTLWLMVARPGA